MLNIVHSTERWNWENEEPQMTRYLPPHEHVKPTDYMEVSDLLGTAGGDHNGWTWPVLGVVKSPKGKLIISPGDYLVKLITGGVIVMTPEEYATVFEPKQLVPSTVD